MSEATPDFYSDERNFVRVVRNVLSAEALVDLRNSIIAAESKISGTAQQSQNPRAVIQGVAPDVIRVNTQWYNVWRNADLTGFLDVCAASNQMIFPPQIRHIRKPPHFVPWHQDAAYQKALGDRGHAQVMTCFVPLDDEPFLRTTFEFALSPVQTLAEHGDGEVFHNVMSDSGLMETRTFDLNLGDVLLFGDLIPHRTFLPSGKLLERRSMEYRLTRREFTIAGKDYFDLETRKFYVAGETSNG